MEVTGMRSSMSRVRSGSWERRCAAVAILVLACLALAPPTLGKPKLGEYAQRDLVSDVPGGAEVLDPLLVNPWGLAISPTGGAAWVANNGTGVATLYTGAMDSADPVIKAMLEVTILGGAPTGTVFNPFDDFVIGSGASSGRAVFLFASESGLITGWSPSVLPESTVPAFRRDGAVFKGLALANTPSGPLLFATDFHHGEIVVLDGSFDQVTLPGGFSDPAIPAGFAPFGIKTLGGLIYVTYAKQDGTAEDDVAGRGNGFVNVFDTAGNLVRRLAAGDPLNSPWGIALAPADFGDASGALLIGNVGDGRINAFDPVSGEFLGALRSDRGQRVEIDGLRALEFGNGVTIGSRQTLFFTAGIADGAHGLFGALTPATPG